MHLTFSEPHAPRDEPRRARHSLAPGSLIIALLVGFAAFAWWLGRDDEYERAFRDLPASERRELFDATVRTLTTVCTPDRASELADFCHEQGLLILRFPECDASCQENARQKMRQPTR